MILPLITTDADLTPEGGVVDLSPVRLVGTRTVSGWRVLLTVEGEVAALLTLEDAENLGRLMVAMASELKA